jgi:hypothetical protein
VKIKAQGLLYDLPSRPLELGEQRRLKREFGFVPGRDELDLRDPDHLAAFLYSAMRESNPDAPANSLLELINRTREIELVNDDGSELTGDAIEQQPDPTPASKKKKEKVGADAENPAGS